MFVNHPRNIFYDFENNWFCRVMCLEKLLETSWTPGSFRMLRPAVVVPPAAAAAEVVEEVAAETRQ